MAGTALTHAHELYVRAQRSLAGGISSSFRSQVTPEPLFVRQAAGVWLEDADGVRYLDFALAWGPLILGHSHPAVIASVQRQLAVGHMFGAQHELEATVAEQIQSMVPCAELITYANSGTEAMQVALRLARAYTGRQRIIKFEGHYHGWSDSALVSYHPSLSEAGPPESPNPVPGTGGQSLAALSDVIVLPWNNVDALEDALEHHGDEVAAVVMEPVMCNTGVIAPVSGYLEAAREMADNHDVLLIFDEVITGFRLAPGGAQEVYGVVPDLAVYAKAVAGGFPLSVIAGRRKVMELIASGVVQHSGTYNGNPVVMAAADATLRELRRPGVYEHLRGLGEALADGARALLESYGLKAVVNQVGPVMQILFPADGAIYDYRDVAACDTQLSRSLVEEMRKRNVLILPDGRWYVAVTHTEREVEKALSALEGSVEAMASTSANSG